MCDGRLIRSRSEQGFGVAPSPSGGFLRRADARGGATADGDSGDQPERFGHIGALLGVGLGGDADQIAELDDGGRIAESRQAGDPQRVEVVARQEGEVRVGLAQQSRAGVVQEVSLAHRFDDEGVGGRVLCRPRARCSEGPQGRALGGLGQRVGGDGAVGAEALGQRLQGALG